MIPAPTTRRVDWEGGPARKPPGASTCFASHTWKTRWEAGSPPGRPLNSSGTTSSSSPETTSKQAPKWRRGGRSTKEMASIIGESQSLEASLLQCLLMHKRYGWEADLKLARGSSAVPAQASEGPHETLASGLASPPRGFRSCLARPKGGTLVLK